MSTRSDRAAGPGSGAQAHPVTTGCGADSAAFGELDGDSSSAVTGFAVTPTVALRPFAIHPEVFDRWADNKGEKLADDLPNPSQKRPGAALSSLYGEAWEARVINADPRIELGVYDDYGRQPSGYHVVLYNRSGDQQGLGITSGWNELTWLKASTSPRDGAREYLHEICSVANEILSMLSSPRC